MLGFSHASGSEILFSAQDNFGRGEDAGMDKDRTIMNR